MGTVAFSTGTAELKNEDELTNHDIKVLRRAARRVRIVGDKIKGLGADSLESATEEVRNSNAWKILESLSDDEDDTLDLFHRTCVLVRLTSWSLDRDLPATVEEVDQLPRPVYSALTKAAADLNLQEDFSIEGAVDPKADTTE